MTIATMQRSAKLSEKELYEAIRASLENMFRASFENCYLEVTSKGFSNKLKAELDSELLYFMKGRFFPDMIGFVVIKEIKYFIVVEIKKTKPKLKDVYQTKMYAELFSAKFGFLITVKEMSEELRRFIDARKLYSHSAGYQRIFIGCYDIQARAIPQTSWFPEHPFKYV